MNLRPGMAVKQIVPVIEGTVTQVRWKPEDKCFEVLVEWPTPEGIVARWFNENEVIDNTKKEESDE